MNAILEPVTGHYVQLEHGGRTCRVYFEEAGQGIPLLCLHTAGADTRQFRGLLNAPAITDQFRVIAFDLPWHGKSSPPAGWQSENWRLTSASYCALILSFMRALELHKPIVMGCSIGGRVCLNLALDHATQFRAIIGLQSAASTPRYYDPAWLTHPEVNGPVAGAATVMGLMCPDSPESERWETLWHYMQGGPGVFAGDLYFYQVEGDFRRRVKAIDTRITPLYLLTGEYDYSCSPQDTRDTAAQIPGARVRIMPGLGHFPMSENPQAFINELLPVLNEIAAAGESDEPA
ncbi:MAG: alpha/beta hydrolase [Betaproteobacteria bacterium]|nr:MAG: alpha/beta hydrolase [Betaproteobacteria bacterium]